MKKRLKIRLCSCDNELENGMRICDACKSQKITDSKKQKIKNKIQRLHEKKLETWNEKKDLWMITMKGLAETAQIKDDYHSPAIFSRNLVREMPSTKFPGIKFLKYKDELLTSENMTYDHLNSMTSLIEKILIFWNILELHLPKNMLHFLLNHNIEISIPKKLNIAKNYVNSQKNGITIDDVWKYHGTLIDSFGKAYTRKEFNEFFRTKLISEIKI